MFAINLKDLSKETLRRLAKETRNAQSLKELLDFDEYTVYIEVAKNPFTSKEDVEYLCSKYGIKLSKKNSNSSLILQNEGESLENEIEQLCVDVQSALNYLIQLFFAKERKYSCTMIKIANILAIVALIYARSNKRLFYERVFGVHNYAFHINELSSYIDREVYYETEYMDDNKPITSTELKLEAKVPERYQDISGLKPEYQKVIQEVFFRFGAYKGSYLRKLIEPLFENSNICDVNNVIILEKVFLLKEEDFKGCITNREFIDYLLSFPKE